MKIRITVLITVFIFGCAAVLGCRYRSSYTDVSKEEHYLEKLSVAEISENMAVSACEKMTETLPETPLILRVKTTGELENIYHISRQKVCVQQVFSGDEALIGTEIYLISDQWNLVYNERSHFLERGFINVLEVGGEYLVFFTAEAEGEQGKIPAYRVYDEYLIPAVFCYEKKENVIVPIQGVSTYVPYSKVKENEFFAGTEKALNAWEALKERMIAQYPGENMVK